MFNKKVVLIIAIIIVLFGISISALVFNNSGSGFDITISNNTDITVSGLNVTYNKITNDISIPNMSPRTSYKLNVNPKESFSENAMKLYYYDATNSRQEKVIVGYFEKGYKGNVTIRITGIDKNGKLELFSVLKKY